MTAELIVELAWKSLAAAGLTLLVLHFMKKRSAAERSWIAHAGLVATVLLPLTVLAAPNWEVEALQPVARMLPAEEPMAAAPAAVPAASAKADAVAPASAAPASPPRPTVAAQDLVAWAYGVPAALLALLLLVAIFRLQLLRGRAEVLVEPLWATALARAQRRMGFKHGTALLVSEELRSPISWGVVRPIILLDPRAAADTQQAEAIIAHELAHVARLDWAMLMLGRLATAIFWFNPLVWLLARRCHELSEQAVDDTVLRSNIRNTDYAQLLISAACHDNRAILLAANGVAGSGPLTQRVERVLDQAQRRAPARWSWIASCCGAALLVGGPLSALSPSQGDDGGSLYASAPREKVIVDRGDRAAFRAAAAAGRAIVIRDSGVEIRGAAVDDAQDDDATVEDGAVVNSNNVPEPIPAPKFASSSAPLPILEEALIKAVEKGDVQSMNALLASGVSVNASVDGDGSPLIAAARKGRVDMVRNLLARGAKIDMAVSGDGNPLIAAAAAGNLETVKYLLDRGANIEAIVPGDENALMEASYHGHEDVVRYLIARGANLNSRYGDKTPLTRAIEGGQPDIAKLLIAAGAGRQAVH